MILQDGHAALTLPASADAFPRLTAWLESILDETGFPLRAGQQILICADEIAANIASYAYAGAVGGDMSVSVRYHAAEHELELVFSDRGTAFNPLLHAAPDVSAPVAERAPGGLGILVVQRMMDRVEYRREDGRNVLTLRKRGGDAAGGGA